MAHRQKIQKLLRATTLGIAFAGAVMAPPAAAKIITIPASPPSAGEIAEARLPEVCASLADLGEIEKKTPQFFRDFSIMAQLPLTGRPVYDVLITQGRDMMACLFPYAADHWAGYFLKNKIGVARGMGTSATCHESLHAVQQVIFAGDRKPAGLTIKDAAAHLLLREAVAAAYGLATRYEAESLGLKFFEISPVNDISATAERAANRRAFAEAYEKSWKKTAGLEDVPRKAKALEAAGQAVVRHLMAGNDVAWKDFYAVHTDRLLKEKIVFSSFYTDRPDAAYAASRDRTYKNTGFISSQINFLPPEYLGADSTQAIDESLKAVGSESRGRGVSLLQHDR